MRDVELEPQCRAEVGHQLGSASRRASRRGCGGRARPRARGVRRVGVVVAEELAEPGARVDVELGPELPSPGRRCAARSPRRACGTRAGLRAPVAGRVRGTRSRRRRAPRRWDGRRASPSPVERVEEVPFHLDDPAARGSPARPNAPRPAGARTPGAPSSRPTSASRRPSSSARRRDRACRRRRRGTPSRSASRWPNPPTTWSSTPKRHERTQSHPRSSTGSPRCASSQSSTARTPSGTDDEVAVAEVAVHETGCRRSRREPFRQPPQSELERGVRLTERVEQRAVLIELLGGVRAPAARAAWRCRSRGCAAAIVPHCAASNGRAAAYSSSRRMRRGIVSPSIRSITKPVPSPSAASSSSNGRGTATPAAAVAASSAYSVARSLWPPCAPGSRRSTRPCARPVGAADRVEEPRFARRPARDPAEPLDPQARPEHPAQRGREQFRIGRAGHAAGRYTGFLPQRRAKRARDQTPSHPASGARAPASATMNTAHLHQISTGRVPISGRPVRILIRW